VVAIAEPATQSDPCIDVSDAGFGQRHLSETCRHLCAFWKRQQMYVVDNEQGKRDGKGIYAVLVAQICYLRHMCEVCSPHT
jgi:hypothetical protein